MIVLVHGLGLTHRYFQRLRPYLPAARAIDLQGSTLDEMNASLGGRVTEPAILVANSLGAQVATELAARSPALVRGLVLTGPTWDPAAPSVPQQFGRLLLDSYRESPSLVPVALLDYARRGPVPILRAARAMLRHPMADRLATVAAPVVVIRGSRDPICSQGWAERLAAAPRDGRLVVAEGAAHAVDWSHPAIVAETVHELEQRVGEG